MYFECLFNFSIEIAYLLRCMIESTINRRHFTMLDCTYICTYNRIFFNFKIDLFSIHFLILIYLTLFKLKNRVKSRI